MKIDLQLFGGRGADLPTANPTGSGGGGGKWSTTPNVQNPQTLKEALGQRGRPMSIYKAAKGANPYYDGSYKEFSENCQRAVVAYEARRRGYDVTAQPTFQGDKLPKQTHGNGHWQGAFKNAKTENVSGKNAKAVQSNIENKMSQYGNGSRAVVAIQWSDGKGHVFNVERQSGKTYYVDAQIGAKYNPATLFAKVKTNSVKLVRTDNLKFSDRMKKSVEPAGSRTGGKK
ncbi:MAG: hypothetical protein E7242_05910 [Lachnospiraceae bacterium]|nr:hypothetical protein [Lachnospiraceae bacterium]